MEDRTEWETLTGEADSATDINFKNSQKNYWGAVKADSPGSTFFSRMGLTYENNQKISKWKK